jgi:hypothetical protein
MCDVPSITVICSASIECFPGIASRGFFPQAFRYYSSGCNYNWYNRTFQFHIRCISITKRMYFNFFSFCTTFRVRVLPHLSLYIVSLFCFKLLYLAYLLNFSVCVCCSIPQHWHLPVHTLAWAWVCTICLSFQCLRGCILSYANVHKLYRVSLSIHASPRWVILRLGGQ